MNRMIKAFALPVLALSLAGIPAMAQEHPDQDRHDQAQSHDRHADGEYRHHDEWKRGARISQDDWNRGDKVDYRANHLQRPPQGHECRNIDGNYVMAGPDGTIATVRHAPRHRDRDEHPRQ